MFKDNIDRFFSKLEWRWSLANMLWGLGAIASATMPAWAVKTMEFMSECAPLPERDLFALGTISGHLTAVAMLRNAG